MEKQQSESRRRKIVCSYTDQHDASLQLASRLVKRWREERDSAERNGKSYE